MWLSKIPPFAKFKSLCLPITLGLLSDDTIDKFWEHHHVQLDSGAPTILSERCHSPTFDSTFHPLAQFSSRNSSSHDGAQQLKVYIFPGPFPVEKENILFTISSISHAPVLEKSLWSGRWADLSKVVLLPSLCPQRSFRLCEMKVRGGKNLQKGS